MNYSQPLTPKFRHILYLKQPKTIRFSKVVPALDDFLAIKIKPQQSSMQTRLSKYNSSLNFCPFILQLLISYYSSPKMLNFWALFFILSLLIWRISNLFSIELLCYLRYSFQIYYVKPIYYSNLYCLSFSSPDIFFTKYAIFLNMAVYFQDLESVIR